MHKGTHILLVDDDPGMVRNLIDILSEDDFKITGAGSVAQARRS